MKQPGLMGLAVAMMTADDSLENVNKFIVTPDDSVGVLSDYWQHRVCCLAEMIIDMRRTLRAAKEPTP